jgi:hypothetical protein
MVPLLAAMALLGAGCSTDTTTPEFDNPFDCRNGQDLPVPDSLTVLVGNNLVQLYWGLPDDTTADEFAVFRQRLDEEEAETLLKRTRDRSYRDTGARNGRTYAYRVAAGLGGRYGCRSDALEARPGVFTVVIAADAPKTRNRTVTVAFGATSAEFVILYEGPAQPADANWQRFASSLNWTFRSPDDGEKTLVAAFQPSTPSSSTRRPPSAAWTSRAPTCASRARPCTSCSRPAKPAARRGSTCRGCSRRSCSSTTAATATAPRGTASTNATTCCPRSGTSPPRSSPAASPTTPATRPQP